MDRRKFVSAGATATVVAVASITAISAAPLQAVDRTRWNAALSRYLAAKAAEDAFERDHLKPIAARYDGWFASQGLVEPQGDDNRTYRRYFEDYDALREKNPHFSAYHAAGMAWDRLTDRRAEAESAIMSHPVPDLAALRWKLEHLREVAALVPVEDNDLDLVLADVRRLLGDA